MAARGAGASPYLEGGHVEAGVSDRKLPVKQGKMQISEEGGTHFRTRGPPSGQYPKVYIHYNTGLRPSNPTTLLSEFRITLQPISICQL